MRSELLSIRTSLCTRSVKQEYGIGEAVECVWGDEDEYYPGIVTQVRTRKQPRQPSGAIRQRSEATWSPTAHCSSCGGCGVQAEVVGSAVVYHVQFQDGDERYAPAFNDVC